MHCPSEKYIFLITILLIKELTELERERDVLLSKELQRVVPECKMMIYIKFD